MPTTSDYERMPCGVARVRDSQHHVVCRSCGAITDLDCTAGEALCVTPSDTHGFVIDKAEIIHRGFCPDCR